MSRPELNIGMAGAATADSPVSSRTEMKEAANWAASPPEVLFCLSRGNVAPHIRRHLIGPKSAANVIEGQSTYRPAMSAFWGKTDTVFCGANVG